MKYKFKIKIIIMVLVLLCLTLSSAQLEEYNASNINIAVHPNYKTVNAGEDIVSSIKLLNLASTSRLDIILQYEIIGNEKTIFSKQETIAIETQANLVRTFHIPKESVQGNYELRAKVIFPDGKESTAKDSFQVKQKHLEYIYIIAALLIFLISLLFIKKIKKQLHVLHLKLKINKIVKRRLLSNKKLNK